MRRVHSQFPRSVYRLPSVDPRSAVRLVLIAGVVAGSMLALAGPASAVVMTVNLDGAGTGTVTSTPAGIDCSNTGGGAPGPVCSFDFPFFATVSLTADPDAPGVFGGWVGNTFSGTCNSGNANPCTFTSATAGATVTATFAPPPDPPAVSTEPATDVGAFSARLEGKVNPGGSAVHECRLEYGTTDAYGRSVPCSPESLGTGSADVGVGAYVRRLDPGTTYHYRVVARNAGGERLGGDRAFTTSSPPGDPCPNAAIRLLQRIDLPWCMALEMVSPPRKGNAQALFPVIAADGNHVKFISRALLDDAPSLNNALGDPYVASRGPGGWSTTNTAAPGEYGRINPARIFTSDYTRWMNLAATENQLAQGVMNIFEGGIGRGWLIRDPLLAPLEASTIHTDVVGRAAIYGASADLSRMFFRPGQLFVTNNAAVKYLPGDPVPSLGSLGVDNTYVSRVDDGQESLALLARAGNGTVYGGTCGTAVGGGVTPRDGGGNFSIGTLRQGAISRDGSRVFFTARPSQSASTPCDGLANRLRIMRWSDAPGGVQISQLITGECVRVAPACDDSDGDDLYQAASADGTKVYFTTTRQLADSDLDTGPQCRKAPGQSAGCDLYLYDSTRPPGQRLTQVSRGDATGATNGAGAAVLSSVAAVSGDGSRAYFVAQGVLTGDTNPAGQGAIAGQLNLYMYQRDESHPDGRTAFIGTVDPADGALNSERLFGSEKATLLNGTAAVPMHATGPGGEDVGGDGRVFVFQTTAPLTADDTDGDRLDIFRYDSVADTLERVSRAAPGGEDNGPVDVDFALYTPSPDSIAAGDVARWVSEDGDSVVFSTTEGLVKGTATPLATVYLWRDGQLSAMPGDGTVGRNVVGGRLPEHPVISRSGDQVAFGTFDALLPQDGDLTRDVYVARVNGGFPFEEGAQECDALSGGCQGPGASTVEAVPGTAPARDDGNASPGVRPRFSARRLSRAQLAALARGRTVRLEARVNISGRIVVRGTARVGGRLRQVIAGRRSTARRGTVAVAMRLAPLARRALERRGRLAVRLTVTFSKSDRPIQRTLSLARRTTAASKGGSR
jgi:hypothetical protein